MPDNDEGPPVDPRKELLDNAFSDRQRELDLKVKVYLSAKMSKAEIFGRFGENFLSAEEKQRISAMVDYYYAEEKMKSTGSFLKFLGVLLLVACAVSVVYYVFFIYNGSYSSVKCPLAGEFTIDGDPLQRAAVISSLKLVEEDCAYLEFVHSYTPALSVRKLSFFEGGFYYEGSSTALLDSQKMSRYGLAGIIVHEACHGYQDKKRSGFSEADCTTTQYNFLMRVNSPDTELLAVRSASNFNPQYRTDGKDVFAEWKAGKK